MIIDYTIVIPGRYDSTRIPVCGEFRDREHFANRVRIEEMRGYRVESVAEHEEVKP